MMIKDDHNRPRRVHLIIQGRVQGVGFRYFALQLAKKADVGGWVANRSDGAVEAVIEGAPENVLKMTNELWKGPPFGRVDQIVENELESPEQIPERRVFKIRHL